MFEGLRTLSKVGLAVALTPAVLVRPVAGEVLGRTRQVAEAAVLATRVVRNATAARPAPWRAGRRLHVPLRRVAGRTAKAEELAELLAEHPDVAEARWDDGLACLIVWLVEEAACDGVLEWVGERTEHHGLAATEHAPDPDHPVLSHPGDTTPVRTAAATVALDGVGLAVAVGTRVIRAPRAHKVVQAAVTALREHPAARAMLNERFGWPQAELARAAANAAARGLGQTPGQLVFDLLLHSGQLVEAVARAAAFDAAHDSLCSPDRPSLGAVPDIRRQRTPVEDYATGAVDSGVLGALASLILRRDLDEAARAVIAASPVSARYTHSVFHMVLGTALAGQGVLVRDADRLRALDAVDTVVLHAGALHHRGELDPHAEAVLDAARQAELRVVIAGATDDLGEFAALADDVVEDESFEDLVLRLRSEGGVVLTVGRPDSFAGLLAGDVCVAVTDKDTPVLWGADLIVQHGLPGVWRVLRAAGAARANSKRATALATGSALLNGLMLLAGNRSERRGLVHPLFLSELSGMLLGGGAALWAGVAPPPAGRERVAWHALTADEAVERLSRTVSEPTALDRGRAAIAAAARLPVFAPARHGVGLATDVIAELDDPLTPVLVLGALASAVVGSPVDAVLVAAATGLNAFVGGVQRFRGRIALAKLHEDERQQARRVRDDGDTVTIDARELAPGDTISLRVGDVVPADARLLRLTDLEMDESALTGESLPVGKQIEPTPDAPPAERHCMVFAGTSVVSGEATAVVVATGDDTVSGRAVNLASRTPPSEGIQARLHELTRNALPLTLGGGALVTALSAIRGTPMRNAVAGGVAIAVAAVPEGLPLVATLAQSAAARRLSEKGILVRSPRALEALGRLDTVCFDKTGTLTENRLRVARVEELGDAMPVLTAAVRALPHNGKRQVHVTDQAIVDAVGPESGWEQLSGLPFEASRGYSATIGRDGDGTTWLLVKGAPEVVLRACDTGCGDVGEAMADEGLRVIAVAGRILADDEQPALDGPLEHLRLLGFLGLADTPREGAADLVTGLREAGVAPVMLTGDHPNTARAIAVALGWPEDTKVVTGEDLARRDRSGRTELLADAGVIARVAPEQKLQVVEALRAAGRVTAMVGDGANDAAAIRAANVGIGVRAKASMAARTAADIALTEDNVTVLLEAVAEGRALWRSVSDAVTILVGGNAGEVGFSVLAALVGGAPPLSTRQFLLVNLMTDLFPAMAVAVTRPDVDGSASAMGAQLTRDIRNRGITTGIGATTAWLAGRLTPGTQRRTSTMALCGLVGSQLAQTLRGRWRSPLVVGTAVGSAAALGVVVQTPGVSQFFGCTPLGPVAWAGVASGVATAAAASLLPPLR
ncbi:cation-translocating P-type ATPase [Kutzneria kofuensis]|uniref:Cation-transporting ATPase I n=1 Tax=Kutzneria kofuensis TaxID=103725 RepID=A0A7W9KR10_9PSEU|nr:cation-translocating P-type ATPase [Kutzneria kofuensis]MBB5897042.1 cation-transporting ATPase I [Kutzneria kofuensis]